MGNPYLNRDESIILTTHNVSFDSVVTEVIFTNQRLILFDSRHAQFRYQTIPLATIETVMIREDAQDNPVIFLSIAPLTPDSPPQSKELTFSRQTTGDRKQECEDWVKQLKEQIASVHNQPLPPPQPIPHQDTDIIFEDISTSGPGSVPEGSTLPETPAGPEEPLVNTSLTWREADAVSIAGLPDTDIPAAPEPEGSLVQDSTETTEKGPVSSPSPPPPDQPSRPKLIAVTAIVVILAIVTGAFIYATMLQGNEGESPVPLVTPAPTTAVTIITTPTMSPTTGSPDYGTTHSPANGDDTGKRCLGKSPLCREFYRTDRNFRKCETGERVRRPVLPDTDNRGYRGGATPEGGRVRKSARG